MGKVARRTSLPVRLAVIGTAAVVVAGAAVVVVKATGSKSTTSAPATSPAPATSQAPATSPAPSSAGPSGSPPASSPPAKTLPPGTTVAPPAASKLAGTWDGVWQSDRFPADGSFRMTFTVDGGTLTGRISVRGSGCISRGTVEGTASGSAIRIGAIKGGLAAIRFTGTLSGNRLSGEYDSPPACGSDRGTWTATRAHA